MSDTTRSTLRASERGETDANGPFRRPPLRARAADRAPVLVDLYRAVVHPRWEVANWRDYLATRRSLPWMRDLPEPSADAPAALVVLRREDIFDVKCGLMLGAALKLEGVRPVILANYRRVPRIRRYARTFGVDSIRYRDEFQGTAAEEAEIGGLADKLMERDDDFASVRRWSHCGHRLGDRILSTLIRVTLDGEPDLSSAPVRERMHAILRQVLANYFEAEKIFDAVRPRWILADETGYAVNGPLVDVALSRGLDVIEATPFLRDGTLVFKRMNAKVGRAVSTSVSRTTMEQLERAAWTIDEDREIEFEVEDRYAGTSSLQTMYQGKTAMVSRAEICRELDLEQDRSIAVVFSHVLWDASFFYGRDLFASYGEWLARTIACAIENPRVNWLIKTHPSNAFRLRHGDISGPVAEVELVRGRFARLPNHVRLLLPDTRISSLALYRHAEIGVTVRGTPGLEMACFGKPVLTAGTGHYSGFGFTHDSATSDEYLGKLRRIETLVEPLDDESRMRARRYVWALFKLRPWVARSFALRMEFPDRGWHPLDRNVIPRARSLEEAERYGDLHRWAAWVAKSEEADYLAEVPLRGGRP